MMPRHFAAVGLILIGALLAEPSRAWACGGACLADGGSTIGVLVGIAAGGWVIFRGAEWIRQRVVHCRLMEIETEGADASPR
jgi:hypothetical protein